MDFDHFDQDEKTVYAVVRGLEIIGEASKKFPNELEIVIQKLRGGKSWE